MPDEMSLDEFSSYAGANAPPPPPASPPASPQEVSLDDFAKMAAAPPPPPPAPKPKAPTPADHVKTFKDTALQLGHEVAAVGDMFLSVPAMGAGALGEMTMRGDLAIQGVSHKAASQGAAEFRNYIIEKGSPTWFADALSALAPEGAKKPDATLVSKVSNWLSQRIADGGKIMDKATGHYINEDDVGLAANAAMAFLGVKGVGKLGPKLGGKELPKSTVEGTEGIEPEAAPKAQTLDPPQSPREAIERPTKKASRARNLSQREIEDMHHAWATYTSQLANQSGAKVAEKANEGKPTLDPAVSEKGMPAIEPKVVPLVSTSAELKLAAKGYKVDQDYEDEPGYVEHQDGTRYYWDEKAKRFEDDEGKPLPKDAQDIAQYIGNVKDEIEDPEEITGVANDRKFNQLGGVNSKLLTGMAGVGLGMAAGAYIDTDNPFIGAALGGIFLAKPIGSVMDGVGKMGKAIMDGDDRIRINGITEQHDLSLQRAARTVSQVQGKLAELVPKRKDREAIHNAIDQGTVGSLKGKQAEAAKIAQDFYAQIEQDAKRAGTLDEGRANYSTHLWRDADKQTLQSLIDAKVGPSMAASSRFNAQRAYVTMQEGKAAGLKPLTEDIGEVVGIYGNSMYRSIANAKLLSRLKQAQTEDGTSLVQKATTAPASYQTINHPSLQGLRIHPDIMPSLKFMFEAQEPHAIMAGLSALNTAIKRNAVSFSLFHAKSLADAMLGAVNNPLQVGKVVAQAAAPKIFGTNRYLKILKQGGAGDLVDNAFRDGLKISFERGESVDADVGGGFYKGMQVLQEGADKVLPFGVGKGLVQTYIQVNHAFDNFMWGRLHAAGKLEIYAAKREALMQNNARAGHPISPEEAGKIAASYANDVFGGLHWQRLAEGARTKWGRDLALAANSPRGRLATQLLMFAPDWTLSTSRAFYKALPFINKGTGLKGILSAKTSADLYRQQLIRSALYYVAIGDSLNYSFSGHHLWENKDWTRIELGDGRTMQLSKHFMEPFEWMKQPGQQALGKLGVIPKEAANQALGTEYLSAKGRMPPMKSRLGHLGKNFLPIAGNQFEQGGAQAGISGFFGMPIYGKTKEQARQEAKEARDKRFKESLAKYRKLHGLDQ